MIIVTVLFYFFETLNQGPPDVCSMKDIGLIVWFMDRFKEIGASHPTQSYPIRDCNKFKTVDEFEFALWVRVSVNLMNVFPILLVSNPSWVFQ